MKKVTDMNKFLFVRGMIEPGPFVYICQDTITDHAENK